jgi:hypothetical protein
MPGNVLLEKILFALFFTILGAACALRSKDRDSSFTSFAIKVSLVFISVRVGSFLSVLFFLRFQVESDVHYYYEWARLIASGQIPGESQTLPLRYGPLFLYIIALLTDLWNDPRVIVIFTILSELILFGTWLSLKGDICDELIIRRASILYAYCPLSILAAAIAGYNDVLAGMFVAIFTVLAVRNKPALSGVAAGLSVVTSKALTAIPGLPVFIASERKLLWLTAASAPIFVVYGTWALFSIDWFAGLQFHGSDYSSGNIPFWIGLLGMDLITSPERWVVNGVGAVLVLLTALLPLIVGKSFDRIDIVPVTAASTLMFMLVSAKSNPHYLLMALFPIMIVVAGLEKKRTRTILYCLFSVTTTVEGSLWFRLVNHESPIAIHNGTATDWIGVLSFWLAETVLLMTYGMILWCSIRKYILRAG